MNDARRKKLLALQDRVNEIISELETIRDEEQEAFDNMPESLKSSARGEASEAAINAMEDALSNLDSTDSDISNAAAE